MKKRVVAQNALFCCTASLGKIDETANQFARSCHGNISPLLWRVPNLIWALCITFISVTSFWGPTEMFLLYMTHWGLIFIIIESIFGIAVAVVERSGKPGVLLASLITMPLTLNIKFGYWFIYMTHWGYVLVVLTTGFATTVSAHVYFKRPIDATFGLPWYVKVYWVLYNITIPVAFLITVFYWGVLRSHGKIVNYAPNPVIDIMIHGVNSLVMLVELVFSAHPSRLLHVMQPLYFAGVYLLFTIIYFFAGGLDPWGSAFIYPVLDWSKPEQTLVVATLTALFLGLMHLLTVAIASLRDVISRRCLRESTGVYNDGFDA